MPNSRIIPLLALAVAVAGCAVTPAPPPIASVAGTKWQVVSVNGHQTPAKGDYSVRFGADSSFGARFGCNAMGGDYRLAGSTLTVDRLISTRMACGEPSASFESRGSAILRQPMQMAFTSSGRMSLSNTAGSISLDPAG